MCYNQIWSRLPPVLPCAKTGTLFALHFCSAANYTGQHPPQIGWSLDGPSIFGRYLDSSSLGFSVPLDDCGGHMHDNTPYHYHTQVPV
jgi:hypothetical protein